MPAEEYPVIDGIAPSWSDIQTTIPILGGGEVSDIDYYEIKSTATVTVGEQKGASGGRVMKRTTGEVAYTASVGWYMTGFWKLQEELITAAESRGFVRGNQVLISLVHFNIHVQFTPPGTETIYEKILKGCRLLKDEWTGAEGTDAQKIASDISVIEVINKIGGKEVVLL